MRRRSSMSAISLRRCSLLSVSMFDTPAFSGRSDLLLDDMDPFTPISLDGVNSSGTQQMSPNQQQLPQQQQRQTVHQQPRQQQMQRLSQQSQLPQVDNYNNQRYMNINGSGNLSNTSNANYNVVLNDRSESSRGTMSYSSNGMNSLPMPMMAKSLAPMTTVPTICESSSSVTANVSPLSCTKQPIEVASKTMSNSNSVPNLTNATVSPNSSNDVDDMNNHRFKPFHEEKWTLRYKELLAFHQEHGHSAVPHTYPRNPQLARWVKRQRRQYKLRKDGRPSTMTIERLEMLSSVGFVWDSHDVNWREKLECLRTFRREHGHCNVPSNYRDKKLATWVKCQRRQYKLYWEGKPSAMSPERILELEKVGFEWEIRSTVPRKAAKIKQEPREPQEFQHQEEYSLSY